MLAPSCCEPWWVKTRDYPSSTSDVWDGRFGRLFTQLFAMDACFNMKRASSRVAAVLSRHMRVF